MIVMLASSCSACFAPRLFALRSGTARWGGVAPDSPAIELRARRLAALAMIKDDKKGSVGEGDLYFATKISDKGNYKLLYDLTRNQLLLLASCVWTLSVLDPQSDPSFFARTAVDTSLSSLVLGTVLAAPLVAGGYLISRSTSRLWVDINAGTQQLALRLFGGRKALASVALTSSLLAILTGIAEELSFRGLGMPLTADRLSLDMSTAPGLAGALLLSSISFGLGHWSFGGSWRENAVTSLLQTGTGLYLGATYLVAGGNVVVPAVAHAVYDAFTLLEAHVSTISQIDYARKRADESRRNVLSRNEAAKLDPQFIENARSIFFLADTTRDSNLDTSEVRSALRQLGSTIEEGELQRLFTDADEGGDGLLDLKEFFVFVALLQVLMCGVRTCLHTESEKERKRGRGRE
jgi:membrane protease YdiL (CAAX protease family)